MTISIEERAAFLKKIHLFHGLPEETILSVAEALREAVYDETEMIFSEGSKADSFFLIYRGKVRVEQQRRKGKILLATLVAGDYFGEEAIFKRRRRSANVIVEGGTTLLALDSKTFNAILKKNRSLRSNIEVIVASRRLARKKRYKWLGKGEVVYLIVRKHTLMLLRALTLPTIAFLLFAFMTILSLAVKPAPSPSPEPGMAEQMRGYIVVGLSAAAAAASFLWGIWQAVDWGNDYYIVTNRRVIWLEKVVGIYDSRQEAPLSTILSVGVDTDYMGRTLDYGDVIVRTYTGKIPLRHVHHPYQAAAMVEEYWLRTKERSRRNEEIAMKNAIRKRLGLPLLPIETADETESGGTEDESTPPKKPGPLRMLFPNLFKLRFEQSETITYRKHWFVLLQHIFLPSLFILAVLLLEGMLWHAMENVSAAAMLLVMVMTLLPFLVWWGWQYVDWKNDIYQVSADQILDINKKPLGREERKTAPLENILSTEYERIGILGVLLNFGTVYIRIGSVEFAFEDVYDPPQVQQDIIRRMTARIMQKKEAAVKEERERMAEWLATYHRSAAEFNEEQQNQEDSPPNME